MAPVLPVGEPTEITAGSTARWSISSTVYSTGEGWVLSYALVGVATLVWSAGYVTSSGDTRTIVLPADATQYLPDGRYECTRIWTGTGDHAGERYTETLPAITVLPDPAQQVAGDRVAFAERNLGHVETAITARLAGDQPEEYQIGGRSVRRMALAELLRLRRDLQGELWRLRHQGQRRQAVIRFVGVSP